MSFLSELQDELEQVDLDRIEQPMDQLEDGDEAVGKLPEELQRLYTVKVKTGRSLQTLTGEGIQLLGRCLGQAELPPELEALNQRLNLAAHRVAAISRVFWTSVRIEFPILADKVAIGVAKCWQVYWRERAR